MDSLKRDLKGHLVNVICFNWPCQVLKKFKDTLSARASAAYFYVWMTHIQPYLCHVVVLGEVLNVWFGCSVLKWSLALPDLASSAPHMLHDNVDISFTSSVTVLLPPPSAVVFSAALLLVLRPLAAALEPVMPTLVAVAKSCSRGGASGGGALSRNIFLYSPQLVSLWARLKKIF